MQAQPVLINGDQQTAEQKRYCTDIRQVHHLQERIGDNASRGTEARGPESHKGEHPRALIVSNLYQ